MNGYCIVDSGGLPGSENMRRDFLLLRMARGEGLFLRIYQWEPGCLSFGRNEPARRRYDRARIEQLGWQTVRRPTGGRAVWHHAEVTYSVAGPDGLFGSLRETYILIHEMLVSALAKLGISADLAVGHPASLDSGACFASPVGGEVCVGGKKLVGSAQFRERGAFLQHGSLLVQNEQQIVSDVSLQPGLPVAATSLSELPGNTPGFDTVADSIRVAARESWNCEWVDREMPNDVVQDGPDFQDPAWTWRR